MVHLYVLVDLSSPLPAAVNYITHMQMPCTCYMHMLCVVQVHMHVCAYAWCVCLQVERLKEEQTYKIADAGPAAEIQAALTDAQEDLNAKSEEAKQLRSKIGRLETAIRELM